MVTLETERTWAPGAGSRDAPPLDVASFLHHVSESLGHNSADLAWDQFA